MTGADYRDMARDVRDLIPLLLHPKAVADLRTLADRYDKLAHYLEGATGQPHPRFLRRALGNSREGLRN